MKIRRGFTLTEVLIALSITLLILLAMMQAFTVASKDIGQGRNKLILAERMQTVTDMIRSDLEQLSLNVQPLVSTSTDAGYFEYIDGTFRDMTFSQSPANSALGDFDDILAFTIRSQGEPFRGRYGVTVDPDGTPGSGDEYVESTIIESKEAEVIYFTQWTDPTMTPADRRRDGGILAGNGEVDYGDQIRLYRRVLLIRPDVTTNLQGILNDSESRFNTYINGQLSSNAITASTHDRLLNRSRYAKFLQFNDVSLRFDTELLRYEPNSLSTLTHPKNRTAHDLVNFPHAMLVNDPRDLDVNTPQALVGLQTYLSDLILMGVMAGNDVVLENVVSFDVKIFDPQCEVYEYAGMPVTIDDPGFEAMRAAWPAGVALDRGSYVDLGAMEHRVTAFAPAAAIPPVLTPSRPGQTPAPLFNESYQFAYWDGDGQRDLSSSPAPAYYPALFTAYQVSAGGPTYTTWPDSFENDGIDNDEDGLIDEGSDGVSGVNAVPDLFNDKDSAPPYAFPVTSIKIILRTASFDADRQKIAATDQIIQNQIVVSTTNQ